MKDFATKITLNEPMADDVFRLRFVVDWSGFDPGQFVMIAIPGGEVFLRRPFGIVGLAEGEAEICYKVVGEGTRTLSCASVGTPLGVLGPCGRGFAAPAGMGTAVLVAGGYGIAPLSALADRLCSTGRPVIIFYGGKDAGHLLYLDDLHEMGAELRLTTEDGSAGDRGVVTTRLDRELDAIESPALFSCGPRGLIEAVARMGVSKKIPTQVSLETYMACGMGVCLGCVCKDAAGNYVRTCREGPVFEVRELKWS